MKKILFIGSMLLMLTGLLSFSPVNAQQDPLGLQPGRDNSGLTDKDPRIVVVELINTALTLLGTVVLIFIVYAGFLWMTGGGNPDNIEKAKSIIIASVVGLAIILTAFSVTSYITRQLYKATTGGEYIEADAA